METKETEIRRVLEKQEKKKKKKNIIKSYKERG